MEAIVGIGTRQTSAKDDRQAPRLIVESRDNTMVCTKQFCSYRDRADEFAALDALPSASSLT
jgi:peroxiredoxin